MKKLLVVLLIAPFTAFAQAQKGPITGVVHSLTPAVDPTTGATKCIIEMKTTYRNTVGIVTEGQCDAKIQGLRSGSPFLEIPRQSNENGVLSDNITYYRTNSSLPGYSPADDELVNSLKQNIDPKIYFYKAAAGKLHLRNPKRKHIATVDSVEEMDGDQVKKLFGEKICILRVSVKQESGQDHKLSIYYPWSECVVRNEAGQSMTLKDRYQGKQVGFDYFEIEYFQSGNGASRKIDLIKNSQYPFAASYDGYFPAAPTR